MPRCSEKKRPDFTRKIKIHMMQITDLSNDTQIPLSALSVTYSKYLAPHLKEDNDPILAKIAAQILSLILA